jgi:hypothetical protein
MPLGLDGLIVTVCNEPVPAFAGNDLLLPRCNVAKSATSAVRLARREKSPTLANSRVFPAALRVGAKAGTFRENLVASYRCGPFQVPVRVSKRKTGPVGLLKPQFGEICTTAP